MFLLELIVPYKLLTGTAGLRLNVYLTFFYTRHELALRVGYLFVSAAIAGALGGLLAYGVGHMDGIANMHGWRWILIIEGLPTCLLGILTFFLLPNDAESAYFLTEDEKKLQVERHAREYGMTASARQFSKADMMKAFKDWKVWMFCIAQFGADTMLYGKLFDHRPEPKVWLSGHLGRLVTHSSHLTLVVMRIYSENTASLTGWQDTRHSYLPSLRGSVTGRRPRFSFSRYRVTFWEQRPTWASHTSRTTRRSAACSASSAELSASSDMVSSYQPPLPGCIISGRTLRDDATNRCI